MEQLIRRLRVAANPKKSDEQAIVQVCGAVLPWAYQGSARETCSRAQSNSKRRKGMTQRRTGDRDQTRKGMAEIEYQKNC